MGYLVKKRKEIGLNQNDQMFFCNAENAEGKISKREPDFTTYVS